MDGQAYLGKEYIMDREGRLTQSSESELGVPT